MGRRGKKVTEQKKKSVSELLKKHTARTVARETKLSISEVYKIQRESQTLPTTPQEFAKILQDLRQLVPETMPAEQFLRLYSNKIDPFTMRVLEDCKPRCRIAIGPVNDEEVVVFEQLTPEEYRVWFAQTRKKLEKIRKMAPKLPLPTLPRPSPEKFWDMKNQIWVNIDEYAKKNGYRVVEENGEKYIDASSIIEKYIIERHE